MSPRERVLQLVGAARRLADPADPLGQRARRELASTTGLSPQGIEVALTQCLETSPSEAELQALCASVSLSERGWVLLSANVFTAAHRAIALALAASDDVRVRPSRREPVFARLLAEAAPGLFAVSEQLEPQPGDTVWAYGSDATLAGLQRSLAPGVTLKAHGEGFGVVVVQEQDAAEMGWWPLCDAIVRDAVLFEGRGCLSPRLLLVNAADPFAERLSQELLLAFDRVAQAIPRGALQRDELADVSWYRECIFSLGEYHCHAGGSVARVRGNVQLLPPPGRVLQVCQVEQEVNTVNMLAPRLTSVARVGDRLAAALLRAAPRARHCQLGQMQRPAFDGPADPRGS